MGPCLTGPETGPRNEDSDDFDPDRWLFFQPDSREGYQDMVDFISELENEATGRLPERLWRALDGRGAFRRFRDVLHDADPSYLARRHLFRDERELGRAREWLAKAGYRSDPAAAADDGRKHYPQRARLAAPCCARQ